MTQQEEAYTKYAQAEKVTAHMYLWRLTRWQEEAPEWNMYHASEMFGQRKKKKTLLLASKAHIILG